MNRPFTIDVALPRGPEHYWRVMREFGVKGFTLSDIACCSEGATYTAVRSYVTELAKRGAIKVVPSHGKISLVSGARVYAVAIKDKKAPVARRADYTGARGKIQQSLWNAMRNLSQFGLIELAASASTDELAIKPATAKEYVRHLTRAGVLAVVQPYAKGRPGASGARAGVWRLNRAANTGPRAPKIFNARIVFDVNKSVIVGGSEVSS